MIYVMSDIHGCFEEFLCMLKKIKFTDKDEMYILGDAIDRGGGSIPLLLYIAKTSNMHLLLGNHEAMMRDAIASGDKNLWFINGGTVTYKQYILLSKEERNAIFEYISELPLLKLIEVNGKKYYLAHSTFKKEESYLYMNMQDEEYNVVWEREYNRYKYIKTEYPETYNKYKGYTLIAGHTPTIKLLYKEVVNCTLKGIQYKTHIYKGKHYINIDCGMAGDTNKIKKIRLGCLRLDDMKEFYVEKKDQLWRRKEFNV